MPTLVQFGENGKTSGAEAGRISASDWQTHIEALPISCDIYPCIPGPELPSWQTARLGIFPVTVGN